MKIYFVAAGLCALLAVNGCADEKSSAIAIRCNGLAITANEFEEEFENSDYARSDSPESRKAFLENFIARKLILQEAHAQGLDRNKTFLKDVEYFWQQSLIKQMLGKKMQELSLSVNVSDQEIRDYYDAHKESDFKDKDLSAVHAQVQWLVLKQKQHDAVTAWIGSLKEDACMDIDYQALKIK